MSVSSLRRTSSEMQKVFRQYAASSSLCTEKGNACYPLSAAQLTIWFAQQNDPSGSAHNIGEYIEIHGSLDPDLFKQALLQVVTETEALRVQIIERADGPWQAIQ